LHRLSAVAELLINSHDRTIMWLWYIGLSIAFRDDNGTIWYGSGWSWLEVWGDGALCEGSASCSNCPSVHMLSCFVSVVWQFTAFTYQQTVEPQTEATFEYSFIPNEAFSSRAFGLTININYKDAVSSVHHLLRMWYCIRVFIASEPSSVVSSMQWIFSLAPHFRLLPAKYSNCVRSRMQVCHASDLSDNTGQEDSVKTKQFISAL